MSTQSAKTPISIDNVTLTLSTDQHHLLLGIIEAVTELAFTATSPSDLSWLEPFVPASGNFNAIRNLNFQLQDSLFSNIGDACRHSAHIPEAPGQGGTICYQCERLVSYLFDDSRCKDCTRLTPYEVQGGNQ